MKLFLTIITVLNLSFTAPAYADEMDADLRKAWEELQAALKQESCDEFVKIAAPTIRCLNCLENTPEEYAEMQSFRDNEPDWYNKLYDEKIFIPAQHFCEHDKDKVFTEETWHAIETQPLQSATGITDNAFKAVILIPFSAEEGPPEGFTLDIEFGKDGDRYVFDGVNTTP